MGLRAQNLVRGASTLANASNGMRTAAYALAFAVLATLTMMATLPVARAGQSDVRLDPLFERLRITADPTEVELVESRIWELWTRSGDAEADRLIREGSEAIETREYARAERILDQAVTIAPRFAEAWNKRATVRFLRGDYSGSVADIHQTLTLEPRHFGALSGLGLIYMSIDRDEAALKVFRRALAVNPHLEGVKANIEAVSARLKRRAI